MDKEKYFVTQDQGKMTKGLTIMGMRLIFIVNPQCEILVIFEIFVDFLFFFVTFYFLLSDYPPTSRALHSEAAI